MGGITRVPGAASDKSTGFMGLDWGSGVDESVVLAAGDTVLAAGANVKHYEDLTGDGSSTLRPATTEGYIEVRGTGTASDVTVSARARGNGGTNDGGAGADGSGTTGSSTGTAGAGAGAARVFFRIGINVVVDANGGNPLAESVTGQNLGESTAAGAGGGTHAISLCLARNATTAYAAVNPNLPTAGTGGNGAVPGTGGTGTGVIAFDNSLVKEILRDLWWETIAGPNNPADAGAGDVRAWRSHGGAAGSTGQGCNRNGGDMAGGGGGGGGAGCGGRGGSGGAGSTFNVGMDWVLCGGSAGSGAGGGGFAAGLFEVATNCTVTATGGTGTSGKRSRIWHFPTTSQHQEYNSGGGGGGGGGGGVAVGGSKTGTGVTVNASGGPGGAPGDDGGAVPATAGQSGADGIEILRILGSA